MATQRSKRTARNPPAAPPQGARKPSAAPPQGARKPFAAPPRGTAPPRPVRSQSWRPEPGVKPPPSPFGGLPVSEIAIAIGLIALIVGAIQHNALAIGVGAAVCCLGVLEFTVREHFSGYRSHAALLAAVPAVVVDVLAVIVFGQPNQRLLLVLPAIPVFVICFSLLKHSFEQAHQKRVAKPPVP